MRGGIEHRYRVVKKAKIYKIIPRPYVHLTGEELLAIPKYTAEQKKDEKRLPHSIACCEHKLIHE